MLELVVAFRLQIVTHKARVVLHHARLQPLLLMLRQFLPDGIAMIVVIVE